VTIETVTTGTPRPLATAPAVAQVDAGDAIPVAAAAPARTPAAAPAPASADARADAGPPVATRIAAAAETSAETSPQSAPRSAPRSAPESAPEPASEGSTAVLPRRTLHCARCGAEFACGGGTGTAGACWCADPAYRLPAAPPAGEGPFSDCLCPACLAAFAATVPAAAPPVPAAETP
jgi:hypothetical protein